ncbi:hydroxyacylglutathione hydrolase [Candidatus Pelagibacter bacterium]|nr:hydroxyacylglutathione hydrolase [Candidatus Pelagibacter bacterium]|tara:strand:- start:308 stop:1027 length:720 start_codon:yes stop_codon:yes gene_type:complete
MKIEIIPCLQDNYSYLIIDEEKNVACVVDPSEADPVIEFLENNNIKLKFILNTHHHYDHVGGNQKLKEKYGASVVGYKDDKKRIPEIDILVDDQENWIYENFEAKIIHVPGHTLGHICFYFYKEESIFTGDTLFSLGCGKIFEGTYSQMFNSLMKLKKLPKNTKVYCGHEYTKQNSKFCIAHDVNNKHIKAKINDIKLKLKNGLPTIPSTIKDELECNIFLKSDNVESFSKLRDLKDNF